MKNTITKGIIAGILGIAMLTQIAKAQDVPQNVVNLGLAGMGLGFYGISYERALGQKTSAKLYVDVVSKTLSAGTDLTLKMGGFAAIPEFRYYLGKQAPKGFFLGAYVPYRNF